MCVHRVRPAMTDEDVMAVIRGRMELLLAEVRDCVERLPGIVDSYDRDPAAFDERVAELRAGESDCNEAARSLRAAVAESYAAEAFFHPTGDLISLVSAIDAVANRAERVATELSAIEPPLDEYLREQLVRMAELAIGAFEALSDAVSSYVASLAIGSDANTAAAIEQVRSLESDCDDHRQDALRTAFRETTTAEALSVRVVLEDMDAVVDGIETAADALDVTARAWS